METYISVNKGKQMISSNLCKWICLLAGADLVLKPFFGYFSPTNCLINFLFVKLGSLTDWERYHIICVPVGNYFSIHKCHMSVHKQKHVPPFYQCWKLNTHHILLTHSYINIQFDQDWSNSTFHDIKNMITYRTKRKET